MRRVDGPFKLEKLTSAVLQFDSVSRVILVILETKNKILKARYAPFFQISFLNNPFVGKRRPSRSFIAWNGRRRCPIIWRSIFDEAGIAYFLGRKRSSVNGYGYCIDRGCECSGPEHASSDACGCPHPQ